MDKRVREEKGYTQETNSSKRQQQLEEELFGNKWKPNQITEQKTLSDAEKYNKILTEEADMLLEIISDL